MLASPAICGLRLSVRVWHSFGKQKPGPGVPSEGLSPPPQFEACLLAPRERDKTPDRFYASQPLGNILFPGSTLPARLGVTVLWYTAFSLPPSAWASNLPETLTSRPWAWPILGPNLGNAWEGENLPNGRGVNLGRWRWLQRPLRDLASGCHSTSITLFLKGLTRPVACMKNFKSLLFGFVAQK